MTDRMRMLQECLQIAVEKGNPFMAENIRDAIKEEERNPNYARTAENWDAEA